MEVSEVKANNRNFALAQSCHKAIVDRPGCHFIDIREILAGRQYLDEKTKNCLDKAFIMHRALSIMLFNFAQSGHPGGSISASRQLIGSFLSGNMLYDIKNPWRKDADLPALAAGHKAMGWYAFLSILFEAVKQEAPELLPTEDKYLRLEDCLGFRKNKSVKTPLRDKFASRNLDGHPTPETPFTFIATGASGVGVATAVGLAVAARDVYRTYPPKVFAFEGEGGMTTGRVEEAISIAGRANLGNFILVVDHNDASIDVPCVCSGGYCKMSPEERGLLHSYDTILVSDGKDFNQVIAAFDYLSMYLSKTNTPKMIVMRTEKGEGYGFGTNKSHGAGWKQDEPSYFKAQGIFENTFGVKLPRIPEGASKDKIEETFWQNLMVIREALKKDDGLRKFIVEKIISAKDSLDERNKKREPVHLTDLSVIYEKDKAGCVKIDSPPDSLKVKPGDDMPLRQALALTLGQLNKVSNGGFFFAAADLFGSLALDKAVPMVFLDANNLDARAVAGGITEDALSGIMAGISTYGAHIGAVGSYAAFLTSMGWTAARLHSIAHDVSGRKTANPLILIGGHVGPKTGEDGPTHACPQALSPWASYPDGIAVTLTPWDNRELWPLVITALRKRPAVIVPFVTRPAEKVVDRSKFGFPPPEDSIKGVYCLKEPGNDKPCRGYVILQGSAVMHELLQVIEDIEKEDLNLGYYYISSRELFNALPENEQKQIWDSHKAVNSIGITDFTMDTLEHWVTSAEGRKYSMHPFMKGHFLGSGKGSEVLKQGGLDANSIKERIIEFANRKE